MNEATTITNFMIWCQSTHGAETGLHDTPDSYFMQLAQEWLKFRGDDMPQPTFTETRATLELKLRDALSNVVNLNDWHTLDWNDILDLVKHVELEIATAQKFARDLEVYALAILANK